MTDAPETKWLTQNGGMPTGNGWHESELVHYTRTDIAQKVSVHDAAKVLLGVFEDPDKNAPHGFDWQAMYDAMTEDHQESLGICGSHDWASTLTTALRALVDTAPIARTAMGGE